MSYVFFYLIISIYNQLIKFCFYSKILIDFLFLQLPLWLNSRSLSTSCLIGLIQARNSEFENNGVVFFHKN
ncbi:MAG: hypothetical protein CVU29_03700 [Betaproteobacteria bacterium HGW-Betaproteobacteria-22]|nr:MAG: hypothetical protein CVU29_03700 [Betaproteobacteria bacterium HGW-Betaproteobacteria-22]